ncbi:hypothetical protein PBRA_002121 [Plasmodiophora brassicae]|uniref:Uncharacterized protein n=1 Tax=Plasmodiophora brassicae TaxID=37360 RepID=A0A0G4J1R9_PLABS|nr:hypothetical protein PBRA_002121 [Plasmodiophora brassicae]
MTPDAIRDAVEKIVESESLSMDAPWPDLHCKAKVLGRCIDELEADIPSRVLANLKNANDVVETLTEQAHAVVKTNTKRELPPNLTVE